MKSITRIAFPLIALASAVFTSCGGGGGEGENPGYYVSVEDFKLGKAGFKVLSVQHGLEVSPGISSGYSKAVSSRAEIETATSGLGFSWPEGQPEESTYVERGRELSFPYWKASTSTAPMDYYVIGGSTGHGVLFINTTDSDVLTAILRIFSITQPTLNLLTPVSAAITIDFDFSGHTASLYVSILTEYTNHETITTYKKLEETIPFERL